MNMRLAGLAMMAWALVLGGGLSSAAVEVPKDLLGNLSSDQFEVRNQAYAGLKKWSKGNVKISPELLHAVWVESMDPEVKTRCYVLMKDAVILRMFGRGKGFVGIMMERLQQGVRVSHVVPNTPAQKAGLVVGDVILGVDQLDFTNRPEPQKKRDALTLFQEYIKSKRSDDVVVLHLLRAGKKIDKKVTLMKRPASVDQRVFGHQVPDEKAEQDAYFEQWLKGAKGMGEEKGKEKGEEKGKEMGEEK
jgi:hypothetical protein